jgi:hypothetical protein
MKVPFSLLKHYLNYSYAQFWFWGQDLEHHKQKTFMTYGFRRFPPPSWAGGRSMYLLPLAEGRFLCLWAYGLLIGEVGQRAIFFRRGSLKLQITEHIMTEIPSGHVTFESLQLVPGKNSSAAIQIWWRYQSMLVDAILAYECWIRDRMGSSYRKRCLKRWKHKDFDLDRLIPTLLELGSLARSI